MIEQYFKLVSWILCVLLSALYRRYLVIPAIMLFAVVFIYQENNADTYHYALLFFEDIYPAEVGFNYLQYIIQDIFSNKALGFEVLKCCSLLLLLLWFLQDFRRWVLLLSTQFVFLATFNNLRQGLAASLLICAVHSLKRFEPSLGAIFGLMLLIAATLFHTSAALAGSVVIMIILLRGQTNSAVEVLFVSVVATLLAACAGFGFVDFGGGYANYMRDASYDISSERTDYLLKWSLISIYFLITTDLKIYKNLDWVDQTAYVARACFFLLGLVTAILFSFSELSSRIGFYFLAFDAYYFSYLLSTRGSSWRYTVPYIGSNIASPSILSILLK